MKKLALYASAILIVAGFVFSYLANQRLSPDAQRQLAVIQDTKGSSDHRGVGAPLIEEFENQIN